MQPGQTTTRISAPEDFNPDAKRITEAISEELDRQHKKTLQRAQLALRTCTGAELQMLDINVFARLLAVLVWEGSVQVKMPLDEALKALRKMVFPAMEGALRQLYADPPYDPVSPQPLKPR